MATILLAAAGTALGAGFGGTILGLSGAVIGGMIGSTVGSVLDSALVSALSPPMRSEGARLDSLRITSSTEGMVVPRIYGRARIGGNVIWATDFREETRNERSGGKGGGPRVESTTYTYYASFAVGLCEGEVTGIGRVWADGKEMDLSGAVWRWYPGSEAQTADPLISAAMGAASTPAYRGLAYAVFEELDLTPFGNRLPQITFEVFRPLAEPDTAEGMLRAVTLIPGSGEFIYATEPVGVVSGGVTVAGIGSLFPQNVGGEVRAENQNASRSETDLEIALDRLVACCPAVESVSLVVSWFGDDLRCGSIRIRPAVEAASKNANREWRVDGVLRGAAMVVSQTGGRATYGGTPADFAVVQAIQAIKARGLRVTFYPFILMDVAPGNTLPNPYSANAASSGQPTFPWRGRITCSPAAGFAGTVDKTAAAATQVAAFFGTAAPGQFAVAGTQVSFTGTPTDWGWRRMVLHYAHLCAAAGGVDAFLVGSELRGLTWVRSAVSAYPAVAALRTLAADAGGILGAGTKVSYAADWTEWFGHQPADGSGDVHFHLDPFWADADVDFIGIDNYQPLSDWRDGWDHLDAAAGWPAVQDRAYLRANIEGGEGFAWFYADQAARAAQIRSAISDGAYGNHWVFRNKDLRSWWEQPHHDRPGGVRNSLVADGGTPSTWTNGGGSPGVAALPGTWLGRYTQAITLTSVGVNSARQASATHAVPANGLVYRVRAWIGAGTANAVRAFAMRAGNNCYVQVNPLLGTITATAPGVFTVTNQAISALGGGAFLLEFDVAGFVAGDALRIAVGFSAASGTTVDVYGGELQRTDTSTTPWVPRSKPIAFTEFGCPAVDRGTNQPNVFFDPKSSESAVPFFSRGWRDEAVQRAYLEAVLTHWSDPARNPVSPVYGGPMLDLSECAAWTWDARPYPQFPALDEVWADGSNWRLGHWLGGRMGSAPVAAVVRDLCRRGGLAEDQIDVAGLWGAAEGYAIAAVESPRAGIEALARHFGFDPVEAGGAMRFAMRGRAPVATFAPADLVASGEREDFELVRAQETELPLALKWQVAREDEDYDRGVAEARRTTVLSGRIATEAFPFVVPLEEAERRVRRALAEAWIGRETAGFALPPSRLALDPADAVGFVHDGRTLELRLAAVADRGARVVEAVRQDRGAYDLPPGPPRRGSVLRSGPPAPPSAFFLDLPQLVEDAPPHRPRVVVDARPWPGDVAVYRSPTTDGWQLATTVSVRGRVGVLAEPFAAGPLWRMDHASALVLDLADGQLASVTDIELLGGANLVAVRHPTGLWELVQFGAAQLVAVRRYRMTRLLRGQFGTEDGMASPAAVGAPAVLVDSAAALLPIAEAEIGLPLNWRLGPAVRPVSDASFVQCGFAPAGRGLVSYSPCHPRLRLLGSGDLALRWTRRSRAPAADGWEASDAPRPEPTEAWDVEILNGAAVVRTVSGLASPSLVYTAAQQTADFGAPQSALSVRIFQLGPLGRGVALSAAVPVTEAA